MEYRARMMNSETGGEGIYDFEHREDLFSGPSDEIIAAFFEHADRTVFSHRHVDYEINGCVKHQDRGVVVAIGSLYLEKGGEPLPFTLILGPKDKSDTAR